MRGGPHLLQEAGVVRPGQGGHRVGAGVEGEVDVGVDEAGHQARVRAEVDDRRPVGRERAGAVHPHDAVAPEVHRDGTAPGEAVEHRTGVYGSGVHVGVSVREAVSRDRGRPASSAGPVPERIR
ncbi:hypothetical protein [Streptomyces sp. NPDC086010]|uniref:hypothetical protein n=1 Tax=Streptomyces sp. NPDC086010 TaxID=3365745 RepID=UPI0037D2ED80